VPPVRRKAAQTAIEYLLHVLLGTINVWRVMYSLLVNQPLVITVIHPTPVKYFIRIRQQHLRVIVPTDRHLTTQRQQHKHLGVTVLMYHVVAVIAY